MKFRAPRLGDVLIALSLLLLALAGIITIESFDLELGRPLDLAGYVLIFGMCLPVAWRHRFPRAVLWLVFLDWAVYVSLGYADSTGIFGVIVAIYGIGLYLHRKEAVLHGGAVIGLAVAWTIVGVLTSPDIHPLNILSVIIAFSLPLEIGLVDNRRHARLTELEVAHTRREQASQAAANDAVRAERARIARELHDVVAHEMTVMTLQAEGAKRRARNSDPEIADALATISESGRKGLLEMQRMIGLLRASEQEALHASTAEGSEASGLVDDVDLSPMPSLTALPALVAKVENSGLPVTLEVSGDTHVPAGVELSAYRIVQESLTNAMKHAGPGAHATVSVHRRKAAVTVTVDDDGRGVISEAASAAGGHGLAGMKERALALGGTFDYGPRRGGGFRVHAVLPTSADHVRASSTEDGASAAAPAPRPR